MTTNILTSCDSNSSYNLITSNDKFCNWFYDEKTCWPIAKANTNVSQPCPKEQGFDKMKMAYKYCTEDGSWENVTNLFGPTDYSSCYTPELTEMLEKLGSDYDTKRKLNIAINTGVIEVVGCLVSIISLIISLCIFIRHKGLLEQRFKIHMNLFVALSLQMFIKLILNIDKLDLFKTKKDRSNVTCVVDCNNQIRLVKDDDNWFFGIMYTPIICEGSQVILEWSKTASFMWMYNEGVYLYRIIKSRVLRINSINFRMYLFGWGLPALMTSVWLLVTMVYYKKSSSVCWWGYSLLPFFWILEGPRMIIIVVNFIILIIVLRELLKKIKSKLSPSNELDIIRKVSKAAIALVPLLGITNFILVILPEPHSKSPELFAFWSYSAHILHSFQGLMVSILYCFMNKERTYGLRYSRTDIRNNILRIGLGGKQKPPTIVSTSAIPHDSRRYLLKMFMLGTSAYIAMAAMHQSIDDPQLVAAANMFVDDIIETAKVEAAQRTMTKCNGGSLLFESNIKKINEWQNRAKGVFRRFMTTICVRFQDLTSK